MVFEKYFQRYLHCQHYNLILLELAYTVYIPSSGITSDTFNHNYYNGQRSLVTSYYQIHIYKPSVLTLSQFFETLDVLILVYPQYKISMTLNIPKIDDTFRAKQNWAVPSSAATTEQTALSCCLAEH